MKLYGKIYCEEGVLRERKFATEAEAAAYVLGAQDGIEQADPDQDFLCTSTDDQPAKDEE